MQCIGAILCAAESRYITKVVQALARFSKQLVNERRSEIGLSVINSRRFLRSISRGTSTF